MTNEGSEQTARVVFMFHDRYQLVINRGSDDGVEIGDRYIVFGLSGEEIFDPDTGDSLGNLELVRGRGVVVHVQPKMSTIESTEHKVKPGKKRTVRREGGLNAFVRSAPTVEQVEEGAETLSLPFEDVALGDHARPI